MGRRPKNCKTKCKAVMKKLLEKIHQNNIQLYNWRRNIKNLSPNSRLMRNAEIKSLQNCTNNLIGIYEILEKPYKYDKYCEKKVETAKESIIISLKRINRDLENWKYDKHQIQRDEVMEKSVDLIQKEELKLILRKIYNYLDKEYQDPLANI
jgi:hypothetical protein